MSKHPRLVGLAGVLVLAASMAAANEPAVVLATNELPVLHRIQGEPGEWPDVEIPPHLTQPVYGYGTAGIVGGAVGGASAPRSSPSRSSSPGRRRTMTRSLR